MDFKVSMNLFDTPAYVATPNVYFKQIKKLLRIPTYGWTLNAAGLRCLYGIREVQILTPASISLIQSNAFITQAKPLRFV